MEIPGYRIVAQLGAGSSGTVYRAIQTELEREVALKVLVPGLFDEEETRARFVREAKLQARLSHPNLLRLYDAGFAGVRPYLAMELVLGGSLRAFLAARGRRVPGDTSRIGHDIAAGLAHAHAAGIIHRDLKPENVLLTDDGKGLVADFGLAKTVAERHTLATSSGVILGTPGYLAPEVVAGARADELADVYALGVVLFELASGVRPFEESDLHELFVRQANQAAPKLRAVAREISSSLETLVARCLDRDRDSRPTAAEVVELLARESEAPIRETSRRTAAPPGRPTAVRAAAEGRAGDRRETVVRGFDPASIPPARRRVLRMALAGGALAMAAFAGIMLVRPATPRLPGQAAGTPAAPKADVPVAPPTPAGPPPEVRVSVGSRTAHFWFSAPLPAGAFLRLFARGAAEAAGGEAPPSRAGARAPGSQEPNVLELPGGRQDFVQNGLSPGTPFTGSFETPNGSLPVRFETLPSMEAERGLVLHGGGLLDRIETQVRGSRLAAVWRTLRVAREHSLMFSESEDCGLTWSRPEQLAHPRKSIPALSLAWPAAGLQLAWVEEEATRSRTLVRMRPEGSRKWCPAEQVTARQGWRAVSTGADGSKMSIDYGATRHDYRWMTPPSTILGQTVENQQAQSTLGYQTLETGTRTLGIIRFQLSARAPKVVYYSAMKSTLELPWNELRPLTDPRESIDGHSAAACGETVVIAFERSEVLWGRVSRDSGRHFEPPRRIFPAERAMRKFHMIGTPGGFILGAIQSEAFETRARLHLLMSRDGERWTPLPPVALRVHSEREVHVALCGSRIVVFVLDQFDGLGVIDFPYPAR